MLHVDCVCHLFIDETTMRLVFEQCISFGVDIKVLNLMKLKIFRLNREKDNFDCYCRTRTNLTHYNNNPQPYGILRERNDLDESYEIRLTAVSKQKTSLPPYTE